MRYDVIVLGGGMAGCEAATKLVEAGYKVLLIDKGGREEVISWAERNGVKIQRDTEVELVALGKLNQLVATKHGIHMSRGMVVAIGSESSIRGLSLPCPGVFPAGGFITPMMCQEAGDSGLSAAEEAIIWLKSYPTL